MSSISLPIQTSLDHRGVFATGDVPLFPPAAVFEAIGGLEGVARIVDGLYDRIEKDKLLRPAFLPHLEKEREKQKLFFAAWFGGKSIYFNAEWRQGLKYAHKKISISPGMVDRWLAHFLASFAEAVADPDAIDRIRPSLSHLANALVNREDEPAPGERLRGSCSGDALRPFLHHVQRDDAEGIAAATAAHPQALVQNGPMLMLIAAVRGKAKAAAELLRLGVDVNTPATLPGSDASLQSMPTLPITPLCGALARRRDAIATLLIQHGAQYDIFSAALLGNIEALRILLDAAPQLTNASDPATDVAGFTPLLHAVAAGRLAAAELLLQCGASVGANSVRMIRFAANSGQEAMTDLLLAHGADPTSIRVGAWVIYPGIAEKLIARGASVNDAAGTWNGRCCTGNSGHKENIALARALLGYGADVSARYSGRTALHCAAKAGFAGVVEALIEHGADVNALNDAGQTPLEETAAAGKSIDTEPVRRLLIAHGAR